MTTNERHRTVRHLITSNFAAFAMACFAGCGGGTEGSGLRTYEGKVASTDGNNLGDVTVTIESTGDSAQTNSNGEFLMKSEAHGDSVPFLIESPDFKSRFVLEEVSNENSRIDVDIVIDPVTDAVEVKHVGVVARFAGLCDYYFENREIIRQANPVPEATVCTIKVNVTGDGRPLSNIPVALEYSRCEPGSPWNLLLTSITGSGDDAGFAKLIFEFKDSAEFCRYRVAAPFQLAAFRPLYYPIDTFSEQEFFGKSRDK